MHKINLRSDTRVLALRNEFGIEGFAVWICLLEVLAEASNFEKPWRKLDIKLLAGDFRVQADKLQAIVECCVEVELLSIVDGKLFSPDLTLQFEAMISKRTQDRERLAEKRASNRSAGIETPDELTPINTNWRGDNQPNAELSPRQPATITQSRVEYNRVEESREEKSISKKESVSVSASDGAAAAERETFFRILECFYFRVLPDPWREVDRFLDHYKGVGWVNKNGVPIKDKLAVARNWEPQNKPARPPMPKDVLAWLRPIYERTKITNPNQADALLRVFEVAKNDSEKQLHLSVWVVKDRVVEKEFWRKMIPVIFRAMQENDPLRDYVISIKQKKR